jgi:hypothetical protein
VGAYLRLLLLRLERVESRGGREVSSSIGHVNCWECWLL